MQKIFKILSFLIFALFAQSESKSHTWRIVLIMQADGILYEPCYKTLQALMQSKNAQNDDSIKIFVHVYKQNKIDRYRIVSSGLHQVNENEIDGNDVQLNFDDMSDKSVAVKKNMYKSLKTTLSWAFEDSKDEYTMLIFSGHGTGILEPFWDAEKKQWRYETDSGISLFDDYRYRKNEKFVQLIEVLSDYQNRKGFFLSNDSHADYMRTVDIIRLLKDVNESLNKKIDLIGFDACHMAMVEIATAVKPYAHYMLASQNCEEKEGWDYSNLCNLCPQHKPCNVARELVYAYEKKQKLRQQTLYSLTLFDLSYIDQVNESLNAVCQALVACLKECASFRNLLCNARDRNPRICYIPMYADLLQLIQDILTDTYLLPSCNGIENLQLSLLNAQQVLKSMVGAQVASSIAAGQGCSIYFPYAHIDESYPHCVFAQTSQWLTFIKYFFNS